MPESQAKLQGSLTNLILGQPEEPWEEKISKNGPKMASKWPKIAFSVPNRLSHPQNMSRCGYNVTNQSTEV